VKNDFYVFDPSNLHLGPLCLKFAIPVSYSCPDSRAICLQQIRSLYGIRFRVNSRHGTYGRTDRQTDKTPWV